MLRTFNCGTGMVLVVAPDDQAAVSACLEQEGEAVTVIGQVEAASRDEQVSYAGTLGWVR